MGTIIETNNLRAYYITKAYGVERTVKAVDDITLRIQEGEVYGIAGESGCGKSTLLRILLGAYQPPLTVVGGEVVYHSRRRSDERGRYDRGAAARSEAGARFHTSRRGRCTC